jgi:capsular polysaccharide biosynthesis protein
LDADPRCDHPLAVDAFAVSKLFATPIYTATVQLYALSLGDSVISHSDLQIGSSLTKDCREVLKTWEVNG